MNGIICINKPQGFTSFDVIAKMRGILRYKKIGHAGTLDPMATGVLPVFLGRAAKAVDILPDTDKSYIAGFRLGVVTDTQDITGAVIKTVPVFDVDADKIKGILPEFTGAVEQIPPMYSAVSLNGVRLYELARKGIEAERKARPVTVHLLSLTEYDGVSEGLLSITCSKGTYVRTLIHDIGESLGCGAVMTSLVRTKACGFTLENCITLDCLQKHGADNSILPIDTVFMDLPEIRLNHIQERMYKNGVKLDAGRINAPDNPSSHKRFRVYGEDKAFIGTGVIAGNELRVDKNLC